MPSPRDEHVPKCYLFALDAEALPNQFHQAAGAKQPSAVSAGYYGVGSRMVDATWQ